MKVSVHQPQYLPWLGYFDKIINSDIFVFLDCVQYKHREFQNRNRIRTQKGWMWLTVPVITHNAREQLVSQTKINNAFPWQRRHLNAIKNSYGKTPYFEKYFPFFENIYNKKWDRLIELNLTIINYILCQLRVKTNIMFESDIKTSSTGTNRIIEICKKINADTYLSGIGGKNYLKQELFTKENISLEYKTFKHPVYDQINTSSAEQFQPFMSIIDLIFMYGEKSREILENKL